MENKEYVGDCVVTPVTPDLDLKPFIGCKIILAKSMNESEWLKGKNQESYGRDGYLVIYASGYKSWSPKEEFDLAYREIEADVNMKYPKYVWAVVPKEFKGCLDIRRYAFNHNQAVSQLSHCKKKQRGYRDYRSTGLWTLFKLVRVNKRKPVK